jgi:hypothetical protein
LIHVAHGALQCLETRSAVWQDDGYLTVEKRLARVQ